MVLSEKTRLVIRWASVPFFLPSLIAIAVTSLLMPGQHQPAHQVSSTENSPARVYIKGSIKKTMLDIWGTGFRTPGRKKINHGNSQYQKIGDETLPFNLRSFHLN